MAISTRQRGSKELNQQSQEPYQFSKEPNQQSQEPFQFSKEPYVCSALFALKRALPICTQKSPIYSQKSHPNEVHSLKSQSYSEFIRHQTATHCNTLQHTATHCNTLQHTATHCNTLQPTATHCSTLQHTATHCNTLQHNTILCKTCSQRGRQ